MKTAPAHDIITRSELQQLAAVEQDICVSLYMPTHPAAPESHQDPVRLRNLLDEAQERLLKRGLRRADAQQLLKAARELVPDEYFWTHQSDGLAVFLTKDSIRKYRLPAPFEQSIEVAGQFLVTPIISMLRPGREFYVLAVSQNSCRVFRGTQFEVEEIQDEELPTDLQSELGRWRERELNFRSHFEGRAETAMFHGHQEEDKTIDLKAYLRKVAEPLKSLLHNRSAPLLFAGVEELFPIFQDVYGEKGLIRERIAGNPDHLTGLQLHQAAGPIVESYNQRQEEKIWDAYHAAGNLDRASNALEVILPACRDGKVESLMIADGSRHSGTFDANTHQFRAEGDHTHAMDILNLAAVYALRTGANVTAVPPTEIPDKASAAAILRVPINAVVTNS